VPQDIRERKGSFFTPQIRVELSQKYIADTLGENWQDKYYVWDCCAGTGNLLVGINRNLENVFASTIDESDVKAMHDRIENGARLLKKNVFQFDFLNDDFNSKKLPKALKEIIDDPKKRKKLIIYINPPYAEAAQYGKSKTEISKTKMYSEFKEDISFAINELFSQMFARIYRYIPDCKLATFGTLKYITATNFTKFREFFNATFLKGFICPANTFDNVNGPFPTSFIIWDLSLKKKISKITVDVVNYNFKNENYIRLGKKKLHPINKGYIINDWLRNYYDNKDIIGFLRFVGPDFQANQGVYFTSEPKESDIKESRIQTITKRNILEMSIYLTIRHCIEHTWINHNDQYLYPNDDYKNDIEFISDCLINTVFHGKNRIIAKDGLNHWIPFTEAEAGAKGKYKSHYLLELFNGDVVASNGGDLFSKNSIEGKIKFSKEAKAVLNNARKIWQYYNSITRVDINASFYEIKEYFQGRDNTGKMNVKSDNEEYNELLSHLKLSMKILVDKIVPKVYEYGFLIK